jgi:hypothetical protein
LRFQIFARTIAPADGSTEPDLTGFVVKGKARGTIMSLMEVALVFSIIIAVYNFQQIKITLKERGYVVDLATGWIRDYKQYKKLVSEEPDDKVKVKLQARLNGLHFSLGGTVVIAYLIFSGRG